MAESILNLVIIWTRAHLSGVSAESRSAGLRPAAASIVEQLRASRVAAGLVQQALSICPAPDLPRSCLLLNLVASGYPAWAAAYSIMKSKDLIRRAHKFSAPFRITHGSKFRLKDVDPNDTLHLKSEDKPRAKEALATGVQTLANLQDKLYAQDRWALLLIFQAMDAAGKDGAIKHVMSGINPQGCQVFSFKSPSSEDLDHDYLWRCMKCLPNRGNIGIFNRSYYEETLVVRVHPEFLDGQRIPIQLVTKHIWKERFQDIRNFERYLFRNGIVVLKFFLHVSRKEQKRRFLERIDNPGRNWKFSPADLRERGFWDDYMDAYEDMIRHTAAPEAPWYVVPADNKWFTRLVVASAVIDTLDSLDLKYPRLSTDKLKGLAGAKRALLSKK
jgi:PPK2 family polyphosphate:nucleotide phosphotransferase